MESTLEIVGRFDDMGVLQGTSTVRVNLETLRVAMWDSDEDTDESISYPEVTLPRLCVVESKRVPSTFLDSANLPALMSITGIYSSAIPGLCSVIRRSNCTLTDLSLSFAKDTADLIRLLRLCFSLTSLRITELLVEESDQIFFNKMAQSSYIVPLLNDLNIYTQSSSSRQSCWSALNGRYGKVFFLAGRHRLGDISSSMK
ncbi:hypothetical protein EV421DRAFT_1782711 [Armillaria borealis]|uniref:Uncharacterized protein n=1 Tax=Armillaria borealis TaxID=47425 RepID=A0AA39JXP1_9AGAR|nr:hypothetical protein EV421DRAFT_1782711 [Armillaria borealis]